MTELQWQPWTTAMGAVTQSSTGWFDSRGLDFVKAQIQVSNFSGTTNIDQLVLETSDAATGNWVQCGAVSLPIGNLGSSMVTLLASLPDDDTQKLRRYLRWRIACSTTASHRVSFRITLLTSCDDDQSKRFTTGSNVMQLQPLTTLVGAPQAATVYPVFAYIAQPPECWLTIDPCFQGSLTIKARVPMADVNAARALKVYSSATQDLVFSSTGVPSPAVELLSVPIAAPLTAPANKEVTLNVSSAQVGKYLFWVIDLQKVAESDEEYACFEIDVVVC